MSQAESSTNSLGRETMPSESGVTKLHLCLQKAISAELFVASYENSRRIEDLQQGLSLFRDALTLCPPEFPRRVDIINCVAIALHSSYRVLGNTKDLEDSIASHYEALSLSPPGHPHHASSLNNLAGALRTRYNQLGDVNDLEESISLYRKALSFSPPANPDRSMLLNNLAAALSTRYNQLGNVNDLEDTVSLHREALSLSPPGHPHRSISLNNLGAALTARYNNSGNTDDLEDSISLHREALSLSSSDHPDRSRSLNNLAAALRTRYNQFENADDLQESIFLHHEALSLSPPGHSDRSGSLNSLADALRSRYDKLGNVDDLEGSISLHREALSLCPSGHPHRSISLNNLGAALTARYNNSGNTDDLEDSISLHREALNLFPPDHPHRLISLNNLANALRTRTRYDNLGKSNDLEDCISLQNDVLRLCPPSHPNRSRSLRQLGDSLMVRHINLGKAEDFFHTFDLIAQAASDSTSYLQDRLKAAIRWANFAHSSNHETIFQAYQTLLQLVNRSLIFRPNVESQQRFLASANIPRSLASDAASAAIAAGKIDLAVEFLEQGRALLWSRIDAYKYPLHELRQVRGGDELANRLQAVSAKLERLSLVSSSSTVSQESPTKAAVLDDRMKEHRVLSEEWESLVGKVRAIEGFGNFLQAAPFHILQSAAAEGPAIVVNISKHRTDAIILLKDTPPELVNLPDVVLPELRDQKCGSAREITCTLAYLWDYIVSPIVNRLGDLGIQKGSHIWWCPTAELCGLPLHAAGRGKRNIQGLYTSSYTSTLSSLIRARSNIIQPLKIPKLLVVGQPSTDLKRVQEEVNIIETLVPGVDILFESSEANREAVLQHLKDHSWVHFACHGLLGDIDRPFHASFKLHEDIDRRLTLLDLLQARLPNAELAFLSACHTAAGGLSTPDESIHLSAAMQFCGFKSVVGTLWEMDDEDGPTISEKFYQYMFRNAEEIDFRDSAHALSSAIKEMRKAKVPLERLVLFVHIGV